MERKLMAKLAKLKLQFSVMLALEVGPQLTQTKKARDR